MASTPTISIDAMGGDDAPRVVIEGIDKALQSLEDVRFLLFGREQELAPLLGRHPRVRAASEIRHTEQVVGNAEKPSVALRTGRQSSMRQSINAAGTGEAQGVVSAGNTGALMAMAKFVMKTLPGVDRPAIASLVPTVSGQSVMLDLGANVDCSAEILVQFAIMGEVYARLALGLEKPTVALLNIGEEELKGNEAVKKAATILHESPLAFAFHGFVEGTDLGTGIVDVIVTDGFTGNVALKTAEGTARLYTHFLKQALNGSLRSRLGALLAAPALRSMRARVDPRRYNGAMFLGLNGVCVKSHGGTDAVGFANAVCVARDLIVDQVNEGIKEDFACLNAPSPPNPKVATG